MIRKLIILTITILLFTSSSVYYSYIGYEFELYAYEVLTTIDGSGDGYYRFTAGSIDINPIDDTITNIYTRGDGHFGVDDCHRLMIRKGVSLETLSSEDTVFNLIDTIMYADAACGYITSGRLCLLYSKWYCAWADTDSAQQALCYKYSDNNGTTWSSEQIVDTTGLLYTGTYVPMAQHPIELGNGDVGFVFWYKKPRLSATNSGMALLRSVDNGQTFDSLNIIATFGSLSSIYPAEPTLLALNDSVIMCFSRNLQGGDSAYFIHMSHDYGVTWQYQGATDFGETITEFSGTSGTHSGFMQKFNVNDVDVVGNYIFNRTTKKFISIYGKASDLITNGRSGWNLNTKQTLDIDFDASMALHGYPTVYHTYDDVRGFGVITEEKSGGTFTVIKYYKTPTDILPTLISELKL